MAKRFTKEEIIRRVGEAIGPCSGTLITVGPDGCPRARASVRGIHVLVCDARAHSQDRRDRGRSGGVHILSAAERGGIHLHHGCSQDPEGRGGPAISHRRPDLEN